VAQIVGVGAYVPRRVSHGRRLLGADEDGFTLAATAIERASRGRLRPAEPIRIELVGEVGPVGGWGFPALTGTEVSLRTRSLSTAELSEARDELRRGDGPSLLVVVDPGAGAAPGSAGSVAFLFDRAGSPGGTTEGDVLHIPPSGSPLEAALRWRDAASPARGSAPADDRSAADPSPSDSGDALAVTPTPASPSVSEGAYVPQPRYLEGLPSRWRFIAERCGECGHVGFPARARCRGCGRVDRLEPFPLPLDGGTVVAETWIGKGGQPTEFDPQVEATGPYGVAIVEVAPGVRATLQITDSLPGEIRLGSRVGTRLRRLYSLEGEWRYGRKAVPTGRPGTE